MSPPPPAALPVPPSPPLGSPVPDPVGAAGYGQVTPMPPPGYPVPARLWLVRHGQTDWNAQGRIQGHVPTDLNETGREQARRLAGYFSRIKFRCVYSSDLPRAEQTARIVAERLGLGVECMAGLRERSFGEHEGKTGLEIKALQAESSGGDLADWTGVPGIEGDGVLWERVSGVLGEIGGRHGGEDVLVVTHGGVIARAMFHVLGIAAGRPRRFALGNGVTMVLEWRGGGEFRLLSFADLGLVIDHEITRDTATVGER